MQRPLYSSMGFALRSPLRTVTVTVDASARAEFFHELRCKRFVQFFRDVAQGILQCRSRLCRVEGCSRGRGAAGCLLRRRDKGAVFCLR